MSDIIYTTGGTGFIGKNLINDFITNNRIVINFERNKKVSIISKTKNIKKNFSKSILKDYPANILINLATYYNTNPKDVKEFDRLLQSNINFPIDTISSIKSIREILVINACSYMQLLPNHNQNIYSQTKQLFKMYYEGLNQKMINIYLFDTFGTGDKRSKVIDTFINKIHNNKEIIIPNNKVELNIAHINDVVYSIKKSLKIKPGNYLIRSPYEMSLKKLAIKLMNLMENKVKITHKGSHENLLRLVDAKKNKNIFISKSDTTIDTQLISRINEITKAKIN